MSTFSYQPSFSVSLSVRPNVRQAQFSDGYQQRVAKGINSIARKWTLRFSGSTTKIDPIEAFLQGEGGVSSFDWTPPTGLAGKWICSEWGRSLEGYNRESLSATFTEVFGE